MTPKFEVGEIAKANGLFVKVIYVYSDDVYEITYLQDNAVSGMLWYEKELEKASKLEITLLELKDETRV